MCFRECGGVRALFVSCVILIVIVLCHAEVCVIMYVFHVMLAFYVRMYVCMFTIICVCLFACVLFCGIHVCDCVLCVFIYCFCFLFVLVLGYVIEIYLS